MHALHHPPLVPLISRSAYGTEPHSTIFARAVLLVVIRRATGPPRLPTTPRPCHAALLSRSLWHAAAYLIQLAEKQVFLSRGSDGRRYTDMRCQQLLEVSGFPVRGPYRGRRPPQVRHMPAPALAACSMSVIVVPRTRLRRRVEGQGCEMYGVQRASLSHYTAWP